MKESRRLGCLMKSIETTVIGCCLKIESSPSLALSFSNRFAVDDNTKVSIIVAKLFLKCIAAIVPPNVAGIVW